MAQEILDFSSTVFRQQGCDRGLRIDELDDEQSQGQDGKQRYPNDVPKEA